MNLRSLFDSALQWVTDNPLFVVGAVIVAIAIAIAAWFIRNALLKSYDNNPAAAAVKFRNSADSLDRRAVAIRRRVASTKDEAESRRLESEAASFEARARIARGRADHYAHLNTEEAN